MSAYRVEALKHPVHFVGLSVPAVIALTTLSMLPLVGIFAVEAFVLLGLPMLPQFRRYIDATVERAERARAAVLRAALLSRMSDAYRAELADLERLVARIRAACGTSSDAENADEEWLGLSQLITAYVQLAIAHRSTLELVPPGERDRLSAEVTYLEESLRTAPNDGARVWIGRRLGIVQQRIRACDELRQESELIVHQLATIGELVRWMHQQCMSADPAPARQQLAQVLRGWQDSGAALRQLSAPCSSATAFDPRVIELGRPWQAGA